MTNIAIIAGLLLAASGAARLFGATAGTAGRIGLAAVFVFTALGHFVKQHEMTAMLPAAVPGRTALVAASGVFEAVLAVLLLVPSWARRAGIAACVFLVLVTPVNIYAAFARVDFGGHAAGPGYLLVRLPLQALLVFWAYRFAVRRAGESPASGNWQSPG